MVRGMSGSEFGENTIDNKRDRVGREQYKKNPPANTEGNRLCFVFSLDAADERK
jgi:hypothetical protein